MKNFRFLAVAGLIIMISAGMKAQEGPKFNVGADIYSNYVFRGTKFGTGPALQPDINFTSGIFTAGLWGSFDASGYTEADPYISFSFPFGLLFGLTDYYNPSLSVFETSTVSGSHALELNLGYSSGGLDLSANYILNEAGGIGSRGSDIYIQAGYNFEKFSVFAGAGNGWQTQDGEFDFCNIGLATFKEIIITENFSVPVNGQVIFNPDREMLIVVAGISF